MTGMQISKHVREDGKNVTTFSSPPYDPTLDHVEDEPESAEADLPASLVIDVDAFTLDEAREIEAIAGFPITGLVDGTTPKAGLWQAAAFVILRRDRPDLTVAECGTIRVGLIGVK